MNRPALSLFGLLTAAACSRGSGGSPTCGLAMLAGPSLIASQLQNARAVLTDPPRGIPDSLPARVIEQKAGSGGSGALIVGRERVTLNTASVRALEHAGLVPLAVPTMLAADRAAAALAGVRGLVLTGGEDVAPDRYGATPHPRLGDVDPVRDAAEVALIEAARVGRLPILAICRGIQILNVALGGTLYQDLDSERPGPVPHSDETSQHAARVAAGSLIERTLGMRAATVNSRHHQAIRDLAPGLKAVAWADDGVIEGAEPSDANAPWMVAVQWHPEDLTERALFDGFARAVA